MLPPCVASSALVVNTPEQPVFCSPPCACWSWTSTNSTTTRLQSIGPSSGSVTVTVYGHVLAPLEEVAVDRGVDRDGRRGVAGRDRQRLHVLVALPGPSPRAAPCRRRAACRCGSGSDRSSRPSRCRRSPTRTIRASPGSGSRVPSLEYCDGERGRTVRPVGVHHRVRRPLALDVGPPVHARLRALDEESVAVGEQVEVAVVAELRVHRAVALEPELQRPRRADAAAGQGVVDLQDPVVASRCGSHAGSRASTRRRTRRRRSTAGTSSCSGCPSS